MWPMTWPTGDGPCGLPSSSQVGARTSLDAAAGAGGLLGFGLEVFRAAAAIAAYAPPGFDAAIRCAAVPRDDGFGGFADALRASSPGTLFPVGDVDFERFGLAADFTALASLSRARTGFMPFTIGVPTGIPQ